MEKEREKEGSEREIVRKNRTNPRNAEIKRKKSLCFY